MRPKNQARTMFLDACNQRFRSMSVKDKEEYRRRARLVTLDELTRMIDEFMALWNGKEDFTKAEKDRMVETVVLSQAFFKEYDRTFGSPVYALFGMMF